MFNVCINAVFLQRKPAGVFRKLRARPPRSLHRGKDAAIGDQLRRCEAQPPRHLERGQHLWHIVAGLGKGRHACVFAHRTLARIVPGQHRESDRCRTPSSASRGISPRLRCCRRRTRLSVTPNRAAVSGINCIKPCAPARLTASGLPADLTEITASTSAGETSVPMVERRISTPLALAMSCIACIRGAATWDPAPVSAAIACPADPGPTFPQRARPCPRTMRSAPARLSGTVGVSFCDGGTRGRQPV